LPDSNNLNLKTIKLTIAIPAYNGGEPLLSAVKSCMNIGLNEDDYEVLIVDNLSTDRSINHLKEIGHGFQPLRIEHNDVNYGRIGNWNRCFELARGKYLQFLFVNDLIAEDNALAECIKYLDDEADCALVSSPWIFSNFSLTKSWLEQGFFKRTKRFGYVNAENYVRKTIERGQLPFVCLQSNLLRVSLINENRIRFSDDLSITTDGVFLAELALSTNRVAFCKRPTMIFRYDAPNRQHSNVKLDVHILQMTDAFIKINNLLKTGKAKMHLVFANFKWTENLISYLFGDFNLKTFKVAKQIVKAWFFSLKKYDGNNILLILHLAYRWVSLPLRGVKVLIRSVFN
jgi:glycosyltransferase involved in cell wall biosynthesis